MNAWMYVNWMSVYMILLCYSMWKYLVCCVFGCEILYGRSCAGWIVVLITFSSSNWIIMSCLIKIKVLSQTRSNYRQKNVTQSVTRRMVWILNRECVDNFSSYLPGTLAQFSCMYSLMETWVFLPWSFSRTCNFGAECELALISPTYSAM